MLIAHANHPEFFIAGIVVGLALAAVAWLRRSRGR